MTYVVKCQKSFIPSFNFRMEKQSASVCQATDCMNLSVRYANDEKETNEENRRKMLKCVVQHMGKQGIGI